jgi:hypothetical protein
MANQWSQVGPSSLEIGHHEHLTPLPGHHGWLHWFNLPVPNGGKPNIDLWPDVSEYSSSELFPAPGLTFENGQPALLFSSRHPQTVQRSCHTSQRCLLETDYVFAASLDTFIGWQFMVWMVPFYNGSPDRSTRQAGTRGYDVYATR